MKIKKIYIENFKGISSPKILDFDKNITLLSGPNGFGKTTSFDVLELCLTGKINRNIEKSKITADTKGYSKVFYRNSKEEKEVIIKVLLENKDGKLLTIVKHLPEKYKDSSNKTKNSVLSSFEYLDTYIFNEDKISDENNINFSDEKEIDDPSQKINTFFGLGNKKLSIEKLYLLFNYLQQEDSMFFLKKSEKERKDDLGFIFNTDEHEKELGYISNFNSKIKKIKEKISEKVKNYKKTLKNEKEEFDEKIKNKKKQFDKNIKANISYNQLFISKEILFDKKELFKNIEKNNLENFKNDYIEKVRELEDFIENFSPEEFEKKEKKNKIVAIEKNEQLIESIVLETFLEENKYKILFQENSFLNSDISFEYFILQNLRQNIDDYKKTNNEIELKNKFLSKDTDEQIKEKKDEYLKKENKTADELEFIKNYKIDENLENIQKKGDEFLEAFILQNGFNEVSKWKKNNKDINKRKEFLDLTEDKEKYSWIEKEIKSNFLDIKNIEFLSNFLELKKEKENIEKSLSESDKYLEDLIDLRNQTKKSFKNAYDKLSNLNKNNCPYCNANYENLDKEFHKKTEKIKKLISQKDEKLETIKSELNNIVEKLEIEFKKLSKENNLIDNGLLKKIETSFIHSNEIKILDKSTYAEFIISKEDLKTKKYLDIKIIRESFVEKIKTEKLESEKFLKKHILNIEDTIKEFLEDNKKVDEELIRKIENIQYVDISKFTKYNDLERFIWDYKKLKESTYLNLKESVRDFKSSYKKSISWNDDLYSKLVNIKNVGSFDKDKKFLLKIWKIEDFSNYKIEEGTFNLQDFDKIKNLILEKISETKDIYSFKPKKAEDPNALWNEYFDRKKENFEKINKDNLQNKKNYIEEQFLIKNNEFLLKEIKEEKDLFKKEYNKKENISTKLNTKNTEISKILDNSERLKDELDKIIKDYKEEMVQKIQIPFFLYTAKILQNYQQGMGIFINIEKTNDDKFKAIRFKTDSSSDHDAMHQLSSGQLATVALAFTLAVNKSYKISENFKFLAIDDPVQEMDSLNIHSFIELMRHEFLDDEYQIIMSTHNASNALFMKYKFEKFKEGSTKIFNVQNEFNKAG